MFEAFPQKPKPCKHAYQDQQHRLVNELSPPHASRSPDLQPLRQSEQSCHCIMYCCGRTVKSRQHISSREHQQPGPRLQRSDCTSTLERQASQPDSETRGNAACQNGGATSRQPAWLSLPFIKANSRTRRHCGVLDHGIDGCAPR